MGEGVMSAATRSLLGIVLSLAATLGATVPVSAATVTLTGAGFRVIYDDTQSGLAYFGLPTLSGGVLTFAPTASFIVTAPTPSLNVKVNLDIVPLPGYDLQSLTLSEGGNYQKAGNGSATAGGSTQVFAKANPVPPGSSLLTAPVVMSPSLLPGGAGTWTASSFIDMSSLAQRDALGVAVQVQDILTATLPRVASIADAAAISKTSVGLVVSVVPEPESWSLLLAGIAFIGTAARRARRVRGSTI